MKINKVAWGFGLLFAASTCFAQQPTFAAAVTYSSGGWDFFGVYSAAVADVNGDGNADLLLVNDCQDSNCTTNGTVGVLLGNGDGTFQPVVTYDAGGYQTVSVAVADVNGDGKPDILVANNCSSSSNCTSGTVGVLLGRGDGTFQTALTYGSGGYRPESVAVADVNGDGKPDLLVANYCAESNCAVSNGAVGVLLGNGDGSFQPVETYGSGAYNARYISVADLNGDGKADVVVANYCAIAGANCNNGGSIGVLLGNGDGTFETAVTYGTAGVYTYSVAVADINGDGKPDIVVANQCATSSNCTNGALGVLLGNGDGTLQTAVAYGSGGTSALSVAVADVNGDGRPDLIVANVGDSNGTVGVLLGNGDGTFQIAVTYSSGGYDAYAVAQADVNLDGKQDIMVVNLCVSSTNCNNGNIGVLINTTPSPYKAFVQPPINADGSSIFSAKRGVVPVKFTLTENSVPTCNLPPAAIAVTRTAGGTLGSVDESMYSMQADTGSNFRIDPTACQYVYNLAASSLGVGTYRVDISTNGIMVGHAVFALK